MANLESAISLMSNAEYMNLLRRDAEENSWRGKTLAIFDELDVETVC